MSDGRSGLSEQDGSLEEDAEDMAGMTGIPF